MKPHKPEDVFRAEKERAQTSRNSQHARLLAEAKAAFDKLMAEGQAARKSGRPRKHPLPPLKTSSSTRPPMRPPAPPAAPPKPVVAAPAKVEKPKAAPVKAAAKKAAPAKAAAKKATSAKPKAKGSSKR
jgi:hypothetical protein